MTAPAPRRCFALCGVDGHGQPYVMIGRAMRIPLSDGTHALMVCGADPTLTLSWAGWSSWQGYRSPGYFLGAVWRITLEVTY